MTIEGTADKGTLREAAEELVRTTIEYRAVTPYKAAYEDIEDRWAKALNGLVAALSSKDEPLDGRECPMCGGEGVIYDITAAVETAKEAGVPLMPLTGPTADLLQRRWNEGWHAGFVQGRAAAPTDSDRVDDRS